MKKYLYCLLLCVLFCANFSAQSVTADLIVTNANVRTMDAAKPKAEALAIWGGKIIAVGTAAEINKFKGAKTEVIDARGKLVMPGFNDAHVHFTEGGVHVRLEQWREFGPQMEMVIDACSRLPDATREHTIGPLMRFPKDGE